MKHEPEFHAQPADRIPCDSARLQASAWIDGELPTVAALVQHLEQCGECRIHVDDLRAQSARLAPLRAAEPIADLWPGIAARIRAPVRPMARRNLNLRRIAAALIGGVLTAGVLEAAAFVAQGTSSDGRPNHPDWLAALHRAGAAEPELRSAPEQRLLASVHLMSGVEK